MLQAALLCCNSIELNRFDGSYIPVTGSCYTLSSIWLWNYWISSFSVTYQTTNVLLLTHELKYIGPSQNPPECITLIIACVDIAFRCKTHKVHVEFCILLLWQIQRDEGIFPPPSGYSVVSLQCFSVLLICKISFSTALAIWNSLSVPLRLINFPFICSFRLTECCLCRWCLLTSSSLTGLMTRYLACLNIIVLLAVMDSILSWVIACWD